MRVLDGSERNVASWRMNAVAFLVGVGDGVRDFRVCFGGALGLEDVPAGWSDHMELSIVETRVTPLAFSRSRHRTVSSRGHEKFRSL